MSKAFLADVARKSADLIGAATTQAARDVVAAIVGELNKRGTFPVRKTRARTARNPRTGEEIKVKAGKTVRFRASPMLKRGV